jgi:putative transposase
MGEDRLRQKRVRAIQRLLPGEAPEAICASVNRSKSWLYKWLKHHLAGHADWNQRLSARPLRSPQKIAADTEGVANMIRLNLYNRDVFCGAKQKIKKVYADKGCLPCY